MLSPSEILQKNNASHSLFGTVGLFRPTALSLLLELGDWKADTSHLLTSSSALLHERVHWLQHIGTSFGAFSAFMAEFQAGLVWSYVQENTDKIGPHFLPLLDQDSAKDDPRILAWLGLEELHFILSGAISTQELDGLYSGHTPVESLGIFRNLCVDNIVRLSQGIPEVADLLSASLTNPPLNFSPFNLFVSEGVVFGAHHLLEGAARLNEYLSLKTLLKSELPGYPTYTIDDMKVKIWHFLDQKFNYKYTLDLNQDTFFHGVYGNARRLFYEHSGASPCYRADIVFATIVDCALNPPLPPLTTLQVTEELPSHILTPSLRFAEMVKAARDFDLQSDFRPGTNSVQQIVSDFYAFLEEKRIAVTPQRVVKDGLALLGAMQLTTIPDDLYELSPKGLPKPKGTVGRLTFIAKRIYEAMKIRTEQPAFFTLPFDMYLRDPHQFHVLMESIDLPLWSHGSELKSTSETPGWFEYFFRAALEQDICRWMVYCDATELSKRAAKYIRAFPTLDNKNLMPVVFEPLGTILGKDLFTMVFETYKSKVGTWSE